MTAKFKVQNSKFKVALALLGFAFLTLPQHAFACAACFGQSDSTMAKSANAGIFSLLVVVVAMLVTGASFFIFLARKAAAYARAEQAKQVSTQV